DGGFETPHVGDPPSFHRVRGESDVAPGEDGSGNARDDQYDPTGAGKRGSTLPIKIQLCDANDSNRSTAEVVVTAIDIQRISDATTSELADPGNANPDSNFRFAPTLGGTGGYIYNLKTQGLSTGTYALRFRAGSDPTTHQVQ